MLKKNLIILFILIVPTVVFSQPVANFSIENSAENFCVGDTVFFTNNSTNYQLSYWSFGDGYDTWVTNPFHIFNETGTYTVELKVIDATNATNTFSATLNVVASPTIELEKDEMMQSLTVKSSDSDLSYVWTLDDTEMNETGSILYYLESGTYTVVAKKENGCSDSKSIKINITGSAPSGSDSLSIVVNNNILTPTLKDGINDVLFINNLNAYTSPCKVVVFNKWGQQVYVNDDYKNSNGFEGKDNNGKELDAGTYYYIITNENMKSATGFVDLIR